MNIPVIIKTTRRALAPVILCSSFAIFGCSTHYYKVDDPVSGKTYYTDDLKRRDGGVELKDAQTGETVTIRNSEVREINEYEYDTGLMQSMNAVP